MSISITRLSGGTTPADGSDPRTFPAIWNATATTLESNVGNPPATVSATAPASPENGDLWYDTANAALKMYYTGGASPEWVTVSGGGGIDPAAYRVSINQGADFIDTVNIASSPFVGNGISAGYVQWDFLATPFDFEVSSLSLFTFNTASSGGTLKRMGLYEFDGTTATLLARTASDLTLFNSTYTEFERSFDTSDGYPASVTLTAGTVYGIGVLQVGGTTPTFMTVAKQSNIEIPVWGASSNSSFTDLPTSTSSLNTYYPRRKYGRLYS